MGVEDFNIEVPLILDRLTADALMGFGGQELKMRTKEDLRQNLVEYVEKVVKDVYEKKRFFSAQAKVAFIAHIWVEE